MVSANGSALGVGRGACLRLSSPAASYLVNSPELISGTCFCPFCAFSYAVTYIVSSVPCAVPFHLLLPHAWPLRIVPKLPQPPSPSARGLSQPPSPGSAPPKAG